MQPPPQGREAAARESDRTISNRRAAIWLAGFALLCFVYFLPRWNSYNEDARLDMVLSVVNHATIAINHYHLNTKDSDRVGSNIYSNKAPGQSLVGLPVYTVFKLITAIPPVRTLTTDFESNSAWQAALADAACQPKVPNDHCRFLLRPRLDFALLQYLEAMITVAIPSVLMLLLFFWLLGFLSASVLNRTLLTAAVGLATVVFPYSQLFFSHVPATCLDLAGFAIVFCLDRAASGDERVPRWLSASPGRAMTVAGSALGLSVVFEYPALIVVGIVGLYALLRLPRRQIAALIGGAIPPLLVVMAYNLAAYHNPLTTGYGCNDVKWRYLECRGVGGFTWPPNPTAIKQLSVGAYRGLLFMSPFLALAFPGYVLWFIRSRRDRYAVLTTLAVPLVFFFAICMYSGWDGGQVAGPRYLMELVPFLAIPVIFVMDRVRDPIGRAVVLVLIGISLANTWIETIGGRAFPRGGVVDPLFSYSLPQLGGGHVPMNLSSFWGIAGPASLIPLAVALLAWTGLLFVRLQARPNRLQLADRQTYSLE